MKEKFYWLTSNKEPRLSDEEALPPEIKNKSWLNSFKKSLFCWDNAFATS